MAETGDKIDSLRPNRFEGERIIIALALSLLVHVLIFGGYELRKDLNLPPWLHWLARPVPRRVVRAQPQEEPLEFVTVNSPSTAAPQKAKYISNHNSVAADNSQKPPAENPELNGKQTDVAQTEDIMRMMLAKNEAEAQAASAAQAQARQQQADKSPQPTEAKHSENTGDLTLGKPSDTTQKDKDQEQPRPRTLKEALAEMASRMPSMTMKEEGGASHHARVPSFDVKITGFGDYDARFVEAVSQNWYNLLDSQRFSLDRTGKVVLLFHLNYDGSISQMRFAQNSVGDLLGYVCEKAVLDGAPYERWTEDMRAKLGDYCDVEFTFDYDEQ